MIWDRRATSRPVASHTYMQAVEEDELPWGGALRLDRVIDTDSDPFLAEGKHSLIRSLRYCRDHRGLLGVLSRTGQLRVYETNKERPTASSVASDSPELIQVRRTHEMDTSYVDASRKNNRIVSFDWVTLDSPAFCPRLLVLRANGSFEILEQPSNTGDHVFKMVSWKAPHRGLEGEFWFPKSQGVALTDLITEGTPYLDLMQFEPAQAPGMLGPLLVENALSEIPIFGPDRADIVATAEAALRPESVSAAAVGLTNGIDTPLPDSFYAASTVSGKLRALRGYVREQLEKTDKIDAMSSRLTNLEVGQSGAPEIALSSDGPGSCREIHETLLSILGDSSGLPREAQNVVDHSMLLRARERYLFNAATNRNVVMDDPWAKFVWDWIAGWSCLFILSSRMWLMTLRC